MREILTTPPTIARVIGIDYDSYKATLVSLPLVGDGQPKLDVVRFRTAKQKGDAEAIFALRVVGRRLRASPLLDPYPDLIFIEHGVGASRKSDWVLGAFFGAIMAACSMLCPTNPLQAREWKREISAACNVVTKAGKAGNSNLAKAEAHVFVREVAATRNHDLTGYEEDALDAYAIAIVGRWLNNRHAGELVAT